jgi:predicted nuclease of predicted toxin-antitoxin system
LPGSPSDEEIIALARREGRVVITFDTDFGEIYHQSERERMGIIVLRLRNQTVESVNQKLSRFFSESAGNLDLDSLLVVIEEHQVRIISSG